MTLGKKTITAQWIIKLAAHFPRAVYQLKKMTRRKQKLALVKCGPGGLKDALDILADDAVRVVWFCWYNSVLCAMRILSVLLVQIQFFGFRVTGIDEHGGAKRLFVLCV